MTTVAAAVKHLHCRRLQPQPTSTFSVWTLVLLFLACNTQQYTLTLSVSQSICQSFVKRLICATDINDSSTISLCSYPVTIWQGVAIHFVISLYRYCHYCHSHRGWSISSTTTVSVSFSIQRKINRSHQKNKPIFWSPSNTRMPVGVKPRLYSLPSRPWTQ